MQVKLLISLYFVRYKPAFGSRALFSQGVGLQLRRKTDLGWPPTVRSTMELQEMLQGDPA